MTPPDPIASHDGKSPRERILVFVPMYDCETQIPRVIARFTPEVCALIDEILVVDNRSKDGSVAACRTAMEALSGVRRTIVRNAENYNLGGSHKTAFDYALAHGYDYAAIIHGDDQGDIGDLVPHLRAGAHREVDCLLGARFLKDSRLVNYSRFRTFGNHVFNAVFSAACGRRLHDLGAGLNCYDTRFLQSRFYLRFPNALTFNYYMVLYMVAVKATFRFFPLTWREEDQVSNVRMVRQTLKMIDILRRYVFSREKFLTDWHQPPQDYSCEVLYSAG
ncbi:MAG: glycosyltransferase family 2 protein [Planctomycetaceae bacterium]